METGQELTYKDLDGAAAGSADIVKYDYISDSPSIPVETLPYDEQQALAEQGLASAQSSHDVPAIANATIDVSGQLTTELTPQYTEGKYEGASLEGGSSEIEEYLQSQDGVYFSYEQQVVQELVDTDIDNNEAAGQALEGEGGENFSEGQEHQQSSGATKTLDPGNHQELLERNGSSDMLAVEQAGGADINSLNGNYARGGQVGAPVEAGMEEEGEHGLGLLEGLIRDAGDSQYSSTGAATYGIERV